MSEDTDRFAESEWRWDSRFHDLQAKVQFETAMAYLNRAREARQLALFHLAAEADCHLTPDEAVHAQMALEEVRGSDGA